MPRTTPTAAPHHEGAGRGALPEAQSLFSPRRPVAAERTSGTPGYRGAGLGGRAGSGVGAVCGSSPWRRSSCSRLVSGIAGVPGGAGSRSAGLVVSGTAGRGAGPPGRPGRSPRVAGPGVRGSVPGIPGGAPGLPGRPKTARSTGASTGGPSPSRAGPMPGLVDQPDRAPVAMRQAKVWSNVRIIVSLPWVMSVMVSGVPRRAAHRPRAACLPRSRANARLDASSVSARLLSAMCLRTAAPDHPSNFQVRWPVSAIRWAGGVSAIGRTASTACPWQYGDQETVHVSLSRHPVESGRLGRRAVGCRP